MNRLLQIGGLTDKGLLLGGSLFLSGDELALLTLDLLSKLSLSFGSILIVLLTGIKTLFLLFLDFIDQLVLNILNLFLNDGNLLLHGGGLSSECLLLNLLRLHLLLDDLDSLLSLLGDSGSLLLLELGLVDLLTFFVDVGLVSLLLDRSLGVVCDLFLFGLLLVVDVLFLNLGFSLDL